MTPSVRPLLFGVSCMPRGPEDLDDLLRCLVSLRTSAPAAEIVVITDGELPEALRPLVTAACGELRCALEDSDTLRRPAAMANVALARALVTGADAVLVAGDVECTGAGWLDRLLARTDGSGRPAAVVGGRILYAEDLIDHAGMQFSLLRREFIPRFRFAPAALPEALIPCRCPVAQTLMLVRHETLWHVGLFDELFPAAWESVDYCLRVFAAGLDCIYEPSVTATHRRKLWLPEASDAEERRRAAADAVLARKHGDTDLGRWVPEVLA